MTVVTTFYTMDNKEGVDLLYAQTSISVTTDPSIPLPRAKLGDTVLGNNGSQWIFCQASATVTCYNVVAIDTNFQIRTATTAICASQIYTFGILEMQPFQLGSTVSIGAAGGVLNVSDFMWVAQKITGGGQVNLITTAAAGGKLFISGTSPGSLTSTASSWYFPGINPIAALATTTVVTPSEFVQSSYLVAVLTTS
jgi:hypothetical protein